MSAFVNLNWILSWQSLNIFAELRPPLVCNYPEIRGLHRLTELVLCPRAEIGTYT